MGDIVARGIAAKNKVDIATLTSGKMNGIVAEYVFADDTARDAYFSAHPTELVAGALVSSNAVYQEYSGSAWVAKTIAAVGYKIQAGGGTAADINVIAGYTGNAVASDLDGCIISGGGTGSGRENVIGGTLANVGTENSNAVMVAGTGANLARILGGYDNVVNGLSSQISADHSKIEVGATHGSIIGGANHTIAANSKFSAVNGGINNSIIGNYAVIGGGSNNTLTSNYGTVAGGASHTLSGLNAAIGGGSANTASGTYAVVPGGANNTASAVSATVVGGHTNEATANYATVVGGFTNKASNQFATVLGGDHNETTGSNSVSYGSYAKATYQGEVAHAMGKFATVADAQHSKMIIRRQTTDATETVLSYNATPNSLALPENGTWGFTAIIVGRRVDTHDESGMWEIKGLVARNATGPASLIGIPSVTEIALTAASTWSVAVTVAGNALYIKVTGEAGKTINWVGKFEFIQVIG